MKMVFGVDIGGTTVKLGILTTEGRLVDKWEIPTRKEQKGSFVLPDIADSIASKLEEKNIGKNEVLGIGLTAPGPVDAGGNIKGAVNLGWGSFNINRTLAGLTGMKVVSLNDANAAALGEMWQGGGRAYKNLVMVTIGTGVGGGIINEGRVITGMSGAGGEIGHIQVEQNETVPCGCGRFGCLEQYASATGIATLAKRYLASFEGNTPLNNIENITAKDVLDAAKAGDGAALEITEQFGCYMGRGLAIVAVCIDPQAFVIGGGVSKAGDFVIDIIRKYYLKYAFHANQEADFVIAELGNDAGVFGAAKMVIDACDYGQNIY